MAETFHNKLYTARLAAVMPQIDLGRAVGVSQRTVAAWEEGMITPDRETCFGLEEALNLKPGTLAELLGYELTQIIPFPEDPEV